MIVNMNIQQYDPATMVRIDRGTKWEVPYHFADFSNSTHQDVNPLYKPHLWRLIQTGAVTIPALAELHRQTLACWCSPDPCHATVIAAAAAWAHSQLANANRA